MKPEPPAAAHAFPPDAVEAWLTQRGWTVTRPRRCSLAATSCAEMPKGFERYCWINLGFRYHQLHVFVRGPDGRKERLAKSHDRGVGFQTADELTWLLAQQGPRSFSHVIERFVQRYTPTPPEAA